VDAAAPEADAPAEAAELPAPHLAGPVALAAVGAGWVAGHEGDQEPDESPSAEQRGRPVDHVAEPVRLQAVDGWDEEAPESVPAGAVPERFADERSAEPGPVPSALAPSVEPGRPPSRGRRTPDERAAEQAAADLALLRTFGFADAGMRPDSAPVVAMERPAGQVPPVEAGDAQPVRYRAARRDGTAVAGAAVTLLDDRGGDVADGTADADGRGELLAPTPGGYVLVSTAAGHLPGAVAVTVGGSPAEVDVLLARSASVSGAVSGEDGPIVGARVTLVQDGEVIDAVDTDGDGGYRIGDIGAGEYGLSVAAAGCEPSVTLIEVTEEADVHHDVDLVPASPVAESADDVSTDDLSTDVMSGQR
jgi:hypothetical protein